MDLPGVLFGTDPAGRVIANAPHSAIGFVEAHGLALFASRGEDAFAARLLSAMRYQFGGHVEKPVTA
jgi:6-phosphogluconate dehydrogenase (decarboxylating)